MQNVTCEFPGFPNVQRFDPCLYPDEPQGNYESIRPSRPGEECMARSSCMKRVGLFSVLVLFAASVLASDQQSRGVDEPRTPSPETPLAASMAGDGFTAAGSVRPAVTPKPLFGAQGDATGKEKKDLTAFFVIGFVINILLIGVFVAWARAQWRRTGGE